MRSGTGLGGVVGFFVVLGVIGAFAKRNDSPSRSTSIEAPRTSSPPASRVVEQQPAVPTTDENQGCSVNGTSGVCLDVSKCSGTHTAGYCPNSPGNVQCCTPTASLPARSYAPQGLVCNDGTLSPSCTCGGSHRGCCSHHGGVAGCQ